MAATGSVEVEFEQTKVFLQARPERMSIARASGAVALASLRGYDAAAALCETLRAQVLRRNDAHALAHMGAVDAVLSAGKAGLQDYAAWIDTFPDENAALRALRMRAVMESMVEGAMRHVGRALGAAPFCRDTRIARLMADLPVFVRQVMLNAILKHRAKPQPRNYREAGACERRVLLAWLLHSFKAVLL
jgi:hypothetical protein